MFDRLRKALSRTPRAALSDLNLKKVPDTKTACHTTTGAVWMPIKKGVQYGTLLQSEADFAKYATENEHFPGSLFSKENKKNRKKLVRFLAKNDMLLLHSSQSVQGKINEEVQNHFTEHCVLYPAESLKNVAAAENSDISAFLGKPQFVETNAQGRQVSFGIPYEQMNPDIAYYGKIGYDRVVELSKSPKQSSNVSRIDRGGPLLEVQALGAYARAKEPNVSAQFEALSAKLSEQGNGYVVHRANGGFTNDLVMYPRRYMENATINEIQQQEPNEWKSCTGHDLGVTIKFRLGRDELDIDSAANRRKGNTSKDSGLAAQVSHSKPLPALPPKSMDGPPRVGDSDEQAPPLPPKTMDGLKLVPRQGGSDKPLPALPVIDRPRPVPRRDAGSPHRFTR